MRTLPSEVSTEKNKQKNSPVLLIEFAGANLHIGSKEYYLLRGSGSDAETDGGAETVTSASATFQTWNGGAGDRIQVQGEGNLTVQSIDSQNQVTVEEDISTDSSLTWSYFNFYQSNVNKQNSFIFSTSIVNTLNDVAAVGSITLKLVSYISSLRENLIETGPDLTGEEINIYLKYDTSGTTDFSKALKIFTGQLADYSIEDDVLTVKVQALRPVLPHIPQATVFENNPESEQDDNIGIPLQYGDFSWDQDPSYWGEGEFGAYAAIVLERIDYENQRYVYRVSSHEMNEIPTSTDINEDRDSYLYIRRGDVWIHWRASDVTVENTSTAARVNVGYGSGDTNLFYVFLPPRQEETTYNTATNPLNAIDGVSTSTAGLTVSSLRLTLGVWDIDLSRVIDLNTAVAPIAFAHVSALAGSTAKTLDWHDISGDSSQTGGATSITGTGWFESELIGDIESINDNYVYMHVSTSTDYLAVDNVLVQIRINMGYSAGSGFADGPPKFAYLRCKGREYSGTWEGRKTAGSLISNPADMIESIFRDEFSITSLNTDSFNLIYDAYDLVMLQASIINQRTGYDFLQHVGQAFNIGTVYDPISYWGIFLPVTGDNVFSNSGTSTPGDEDIFNSVSNLSSGSFTQHPIVKGSMKLSRSAGRDVYDQLVLRYNYEIETDKFVRKSVGGSGERIKTIDNPYVAHESAAEQTHAKIANWWWSQKWICEFETFWNGVAFQVGDVINVRHEYLNDEILTMTQNTQKWMIFDVRATWRPNVIRVSAIELYAQTEVEFEE